MFTLPSMRPALLGAQQGPSATGPRGAGRPARRALLLAALLALAGAVAPAAPAQALEFRTTEIITVPAGTVIDDDLFAAGETITIAGQVNGDVYAFGRSITVTGTIQRDLIAVGQQITVDGVINGDLRGGGQNVVINGRVDGNVTSGAQLVSLGRQGRVDGSVYGAAQDFDLLGPVGRGVAVGAAALLIGGTVGGNVDAHVERLTVDPAARIAGRLDYTSDREAAVPAGIAAGGVQFHQVERQESRRDAERENPFGGLFSFFNLAWLVGSIIAGVLLVHFLPGFAAGAAAQVRDHPLASFGIGILALFVVPIAALLVAFTIVGLPLSLLAGLGYLLGLYLGWLLLGLAVGGLLVGLARRGGAPARVDPRWLVVLGLVVLYVLTHLPFIGGLATFVAVCLGLGALLRELAAERPGHAVALPPPA